MAEAIQATPQEEALMALHNGNFEMAASGILQAMSNGNAAATLSVVRSEALMHFAESWLSSREGWPPAGGGTYKAERFSHYYSGAVEGDPAAISALPKFSTSVGQLTLAMEVTLDFRESVAGWRDGREYLQYLGSFSPQHIGHRVAIGSTLEAAGEQASMLVHVMDAHPRKIAFGRPYRMRFLDSEWRLYHSPLLDNTRVTQVDIPGGVGFATQGLAQMELLAEATGDPKLRWVIGSDKLLLDANTVRHNPEKATKATLRFADPRMVIYAVHRQTESLEQLHESADYVRERFGTEIILVEEWPYDCAPASSSRIKELRAAGRDEEAVHMEYYELPHA